MTISYSFGYFSIVTLNGAHTLGHVHLQNSGYSVERFPKSITVNAWDSSPTKFDNLYFQNLIGNVSEEIVIDHILISYSSLQYFV